VPSANAGIVSLGASSTVGASGEARPAQLLKKHIPLEQKDVKKKAAARG
jgi:hypothetical protein